MTNIMLVCSAGMSTSILVDKMEKAAKDKGLEVHVEALAMAAARPRLPEFDVVLLGPQVKFIEKDIKENTDKPVDVIPSNLYAMAKGKEVLELALKMINK